MASQQSNNSWGVNGTLAFHNEEVRVPGCLRMQADPNRLLLDHVSEYGLKKLCLNIKFGLYRAFGMKPPEKQAPAES